MNSEIAIIESRRFARRVIEKLRLDRDAEFNSALRDSGGIFSTIRSLFSSSGKSKLPTVLAVNDARAIAPLVDTAVFVTRWGKIRRETASYAIAQLAKSGARIAGVALTRVELKKHAEYGYADSGHYHRKYADYYTT